MQFKEPALCDITKGINYSPGSVTTPPSSSPGYVLAPPNKTSLFLPPPKRGTSNKASILAKGWRMKKY